MRVASFAERVSRLDSLAAELVAQRIDCAFRQRPLARLNVDQVGRIRPVCAGKVAHADPEQAVFCAVRLLFQKLQSGLKDAIRQPRRIAELPVPGADLEVLQSSV